MAGSSVRTSLLLSGRDSDSSTMVSFGTGLVTVPALLVDLPVGDFMGVAALEPRILVGLAVLVRGGACGRFGGTELAAPPTVVRLVRSVAGSILAVRELAVPMVDMRAGLLFSAPAFEVTAAPSLLAGFRAAVAVGRVGGLLMVLPLVRDDRPLVLPFDAGAVGVRELLIFFASSVVNGFRLPAADGTAPVVVRLSMLIFVAPYNLVFKTVSLYTSFRSCTYLPDER